MLSPDVHAVCVLHPADDDAARLARVDAAADRQALERRVLGLARDLKIHGGAENTEEAAYLRTSYAHDCRCGGPIGPRAASSYLDCVAARLAQAPR